MSEKPSCQELWLKVIHPNVAGVIVAEFEHVEIHLMPDSVTTLEEAKADYQDVKVYDFKNMQSNEERNMFFTFKTTYPNFI